MTIPTNQRLVHALQGNDQMARNLSFRFVQNAPMLLVMLEQAWNRGDRASFHGARFKLCSYLRVMGHDRALECILLLPEPSGTIRLRDLKEWRELQLALADVFR
ncbi:MAG: hypothetical protein ACO2ZL_02620 [Flavobacteriales bacterium]